MSASQNFAMDQAALAFGSYLRAQKPYETFGVFLTVIWLFAGLFSSEFLYLISMTLSAGIFVISSLVKLDPRKRAISVIHTSSFRRLIVAFIANWGYTSGRTGDSEIDFFSFIIPINEIASLVIVVLFIIWMATKYAEAIDRNGFDFIRTPLLFLRGFLRSIILVAVLYSVVTRGDGPDISEQLQEPIVLAFIIEPFVYVIYSEFNQSRSTSDMVLGDSRLPAVALRESFLTNLVMIFMLFWFKGVSGPEWEFLRAVYVIGFFFTLFSSLQSIKDYNTNPLGKGNLANFLNDTPSHLENFNLDSKIGHVIDEVTNLSLGNDSDLKISKGSVVIPIARHKKTISALIVGQTESIISDGSQKIAEMNDGITTAIISKKDFEKVTKKFVGRQVSTIDMNSIGLPSLEVIGDLIQRLGEDLGGWVGNIKKELTKYNLSSYGVSEINGVTTVNFPGISIIDGPGMSIIKVGGVRVVDTGSATSVRIGNFLTVVDMPKMNLVSLPGLTVLDVAGVGSAVDIMGFKVSQDLDATRLDEFKKAFLQHLDGWEREVESNLGRIISNQKSSAQMSMSWSGEFKPLLKSNEKAFGDHLALGEASQSSRLLLPGYVEGDLPRSNAKLIELTGLDDPDLPVRKKRIKTYSSKKRGSKRIIQYDLEFGRGDKQVSVSNMDKIERRQAREDRKAQRQAAKLERTQRKIDKKLESAQRKIDRRLDKIDQEISGEEVEEIEEAEQELEGVTNVIDVDYEIVDDDDDEIIEDESLNSK